jgi:hypothetical protein
MACEGDPIVSAHHDANDANNHLDNVDIYRRGEETSICAVCQQHNQRESAVRECVACATPLCDEHLPEPYRTCTSCRRRLEERQELWGFGSWRMHVLVWSTLGLPVALLVWDTWSGTNMLSPLLHKMSSGMIWALFGAFVLLPFVVVGLATHLKRRRSRFRPDEGLFAQEQRRGLERRRSRHRKSKGQLNG